MEYSPEITMFLCANCARTGKEPTSAGRNRPIVPEFNLPGRVEQIVVPCTGRLQPEHILRAFEAGSKLVSVVACQDDNCHYAEGSRRCALRIDYIRSILSEIGLGDGRLLLFHLPGSASEDMAKASGSTACPVASDGLDDQIASVRTRMVEALQAHPPNPLGRFVSKPSPVDFDEDLALNEGGGDE